ncbi:S8/S53 family peptidase [Sphingobium yanoikuyae]|uniref:S8/S53 family peptidase n=1 Tax=Sphingobium yanoikuyae TaxID=13690 RepID=UPI0022DE6ED8|nr:S8/S53 family peptidase [Sphingobium yanoikuyae]WBQ15834.1 S8/S53 family peptidase [Sphingobium yanoikuyae]
MSIRTCWFASSSLLLAQGAALSAQPPSIHAIEVQLDQGYLPGMATAFAKIGLPKSRQLSDTETVVSLIETECGIIDPEYLDAFIDENGLARSQATADSMRAPAPGTSYVFPYCLSGVPQTVEVGQGNSLSKIFASQQLPLDANALQQARRFFDITMRSLGSLRLFGETADAGSNRGFVATEYARKFQRENPGQDPARLKPTDRVKIDPDHLHTIVPLRTGIDLAKARSELDALGVRIDVVAAVPAGLTGNIVPREGTCAGDLPVDWPVSVPALRQTLDQLQADRPADAETPAPAGVLVVDTGYDPVFGAPGIPAGSTAQLRNTRPDSIKRFVGLTAGDRLKKDAIPPQTLGERMHGFEVAATLLGGAYLPANRNFILLPKLSFASIATRDANGSAYLDPTAMDAAYELALDNGIHIINASIAATGTGTSFLSKIRSDPRTLFVTAAGNVTAPPQNFTAQSTNWPGSMGGETVNAGDAVVISVGGHDFNGKLLYFSRRGNEVDLLAPGCRIPTYVEDGAGGQKVGERHGTSYGAAIVSFVAAQLAQQGLRPAAIKDRLILSADVDERVADDSWSGGRLNVAGALTLWRDMISYVTIENGLSVPHRATGKLTSLFNKVRLCGGELIEQSQLRKITYSVDPEDATKPAQWRIWKSRAKPQPSTAVEKLPACQADPNSFTGQNFIFLRNGDSQPIVIAPDELRSFVAGLAPP